MQERELARSFGTRAPTFFSALLIRHPLALVGVAARGRANRTPATGPTLCSRARVRAPGEGEGPAARSHSHSHHTKA